jgi:hypothetical protein
MEMLMNLRNRTELKETVRAFAVEAAIRDFRSRHPRASEATAGRFATRHWERFVPAACDALALLHCLDEAEAAGTN